MNINSITSPCISVCKTDPVSGFCYGCGRSTEDKIKWKDQTTTKYWKEENLKIIRERLSGWQQIAFDQAYKNKKKTGMSLIKQQIIESKK